MLDVVWPLSLVLFAAAAWQPRHPHRRRRLDGWRTLAGPAFAGLCALAVVLYDHYHRVTAVSMWLAAAALLALMLRLTLLMAAHRRMLASAERDGRTDALTGLRNRRELAGRPRTGCERRRGRRPRALRPRRLQGLQRQLRPPRRRRPAEAARAAARRGRRAARRRAYRLGGDEFCVALRAARRAGAGIIAARGARRSASTARASRSPRRAAPCRSPTRRTTPSDALRARRRAHVRRQARRPHVAGRADRATCCCASLTERTPALGAHVGDVAAWPSRRRHALGLAPSSVDAASGAAAAARRRQDGDPRRDPRTSPARSTRASGSSCAQHTIDRRADPARGARAAPTSRALVRSSHERWDGGGYPDGLAGEDIPLGARIITVCDAYDAMTSRPRRTARRAPADGAIAELRRCAGTQFDPAVVDASRRRARGRVAESRPAHTWSPAPRFRAPALPGRPARRSRSMGRC